MRHRGYRRQLPIAEMAGKDQRGLAVEAKLRKQLVGARQDFDPAFFGEGGIVLPDVIEMGEFGAKAAEIVPYAGENGLNLLR